MVHLNPKDGSRSRLSTMKEKSMLSSKYAQPAAPPSLLYYDYFKEDRGKADFGTMVSVQMSQPVLSAQYEWNGL